MQAIRKKIVVDDRGNPREVIISWAQFQEMSEALGLDLDAKAKLDLRAALRDLKSGKSPGWKCCSDDTYSSTSRGDEQPQRRRKDLLD
jgi:PHD/YefM family antitoxin component YafN of YafNO toxin-antitoxin module